MENWLPIILGLFALVVVLKVVKGFVKLIGIAIIIAVVAAIYFGIGG